VNNAQKSSDNRDITIQGAVSKKGHLQQPPERPSLHAVGMTGHLVELGASLMTEERARHYAKVLARGMGKTFYVVCSREGRFLAVQIPSDDCEILATVAPLRRARDTPQLRHEQRAA
jgi:hypothetical protein